MRKRTKCITLSTIAFNIILFILLLYSYAIEAVEPSEAPMLTTTTAAAASSDIPWCSVGYQIVNAQTAAYYLHELISKQASSARLQRQLIQPGRLRADWLMRVRAQHLPAIGCRLVLIDRRLSARDVLADYRDAELMLHT